MSGKEPINDGFLTIFKIGRSKSFMMGEIITSLALMISGSPFVLMGIAAFLLMLFHNPNSNNGIWWTLEFIYLLVVIVSIGCIIFYAGLNKMRNLIRRIGVERRFPEESWMWEPEWTQTEVAPIENKTHKVFVLAGYAVWIVSGLFVMIGIDEIAKFRIGNILFFIILAFGLMKYSRWFNAFRKRSELYREIRFVRDKSPIAPGENLKGKILFPMGFQFDGPCAIILKVIITSPGSHRNKNVIVINKEVVENPNSILMKNNDSLPCAILIPEDAQETNDIPDGKCAVEYELCVCTEKNGKELKWSFDTPVFRRTEVEQKGTVQTGNVSASLVENHGEPQIPSIAAVMEPSGWMFTSSTVQAFPLLIIAPLITFGAFVSSCVIFSLFVEHPSFVVWAIFIVSALAMLFVSIESLAMINTKIVTRIDGQGVEVETRRLTTQKRYYSKSDIQRTEKTLIGIWSLDEYFELTSFQGYYSLSMRVRGNDKPVLLAFYLLKKDVDACEWLLWKTLNGGVT